MNRGIHHMRSPVVCKADVGLVVNVEKNGGLNILAIRLQLILLAIEHYILVVNNKID